MKFSIASRLIWPTLCLASFCFAPGCATPSQRFATAEDAVDELIRAVRANDQPSLLKVLGSDAKDILSSGDAVADENARESFLQAYDEKHSLVTDPDGYVTLVMGNKDWPMPIPITKDEEKNQWYFDTEVGKDEIINRRIGRNELDAMQTCLAIMDAQKEYAMSDPDGDGVPEYAEKFLSDQGKKNGLFWRTAEGEPLSPLGELAAAAAAEGYKRSESGKLEPYHGYYYHMLTSQGSHAPCGAYEYVVNGQMIGGFAVMAWPADYGNSGLKSFMISHSGDLYERDLGDDTDKIAKAISGFDPGDGWVKVQPPAPEPD
jgi:hypothetical protein